MFIVCVVTPVDQLYPAKTPASKIFVDPLQIVDAPVITGFGNANKTVVADVLALQPLASVTVTVNVAAVFTVIVCINAPVDH